MRERLQRAGLNDIVEKLEAGGADVREIILFRSELLPRGAVHTPLDRFPLGGGGVTFTVEPIPVTDFDE